MQYRKATWKRFQILKGHIWPGIAMSSKSMKLKIQVNDFEWDVIVQWPLYEQIKFF